MSYWSVQSSPLSLESPSESNDDEESEDVSDEDVLSESRSECSKEYDDDDFDNKSLEIDEEERSKISAQINPDEEEEDDDRDDDTEEEKETIPEKEDSEQEKNQEEFHQDESTAPIPQSSLRSSFDDDLYQGHATAAGLDEGETSMTESAESRTLDVCHVIQKLDLERKQLLQELERDEQHRQYFYNKLKTITQKIENLHPSENGLAHTDVVRHQLEMEAYQVQRAMEEKLGLSEERKLKQEGLHNRIRSIESEIISLQGRARKVHRIIPDQENVDRGRAVERTVANNSHPAVRSAETGDSALVKTIDGVAAGIPLGSNHLPLYRRSRTPERRNCGSPGTHPSSQEQVDAVSFRSFSSGSPGPITGSPRSSMFSLANSPGDQSQHMGTKVEMVYSLLSILGSHDKDDMARTLFAMSQSQDSCIAMRQSGCLPLLLQLLHGNEKDPGLLGKTRGSKAARALASAALHNIVHCHHDDKRGRREARTLRLLEQIRAHCDQQRGESDDRDGEASASNCLEMDHHPGAAIAALMKLSFDEDYRHAICTLGGLQAIAELLEVENKAATPMNDYSTTIRRYSCMALTNLTFGDGKNKALLCSMRCAIEALTDQLRSTNEDLIQAAASVLRNLSWRADLASKKALREIGAVTTLMRAAMSAKKETTLKSILSALWNLSSHCSENKAEICAVEGALQFLVSLLTYKSTAKTLAIIENGGGILRNVSSQIATREDYRQILRKQDCLKILLFHLKSPSLTIVSNACGTLWNLSARCEEDQNALRDMGAVSMLRNLVHSRHKMISSGSSAALKNLLSSVPAGKSVNSDRSAGSPRPSLHVRKQRAMEAELDHNLSETCENVDSPRNSPTEIVVHRSESEPRRFVYHLNGGGGGHRYDEDTRKHMTRRQMMPRNCIENINNYEIYSGYAARAGSQDSVGSTHSDISHDRTRTRSMLARSSHLLNKRQGHSLERKGHQVGTYGSTLQPNHLPNMMSNHKTYVDQNNLNSDSLKMVNDVPALIYQPSSIILHHSQPPQHHHNQSWLTLPNNQYMHDAAVSTDSELSGSHHSQPLLTQSAPSHSQSFHPPDTPNQKPQQPSLLERLAKSSSGLSSSCNLNYSITAANSSFYSSSSSTDYCGQHALSSPVFEDADQPVNYSLKQQDDTSSSSRLNKPAPSTNMHLSCDHLTLAGRSQNTRAGALGGMNASLNERNLLLNNSLIQDKVLGGNRPEGKVVGANITVNQAAQIMHKPVPNLVHNQFHSNPNDCHSADTQHNQSHFVSPQMLYASNSSFSTLDCHHLSSHPHHIPNQGLPFASTISSGCASQGKTFSGGLDQFHTLQAAHQNVAHVCSVHQLAGESDPDLAVNQPADLSMCCSDTSENCDRDYQEQPINYSVRFSDGERKGGQETKAKNQEIKTASQEVKGNQDEKQTVDCRSSWLKHPGDSGSDDIQVVYPTKGSFQKSGATSVIETNKYERNECDMEEEDDETESEGSDHDFKTEEAEMSTDKERAGSGSEPHVAASVSGTIEQVNVYHEIEVPACLTRFPSARSRHYTEIREANDHLEQGLIREKAEETSPTFTGSSSEESLSSLEAQPVDNSVFSGCSQKTAGAVSDIRELAAESALQRPVEENVLSKEAKRLPIIPKSSNVITKQSLSFDKVHSSCKSESFVSFTAFNEEDKPISFAVRNHDMPLNHGFPRFDDGHAVDFSSFSTEQEQPHLTFSTFQKNFQPPSANQVSHFNSRLVTPRAKTMPTLIEQTAEVESAPGRAELPEICSEDEDAEVEIACQSRSSVPLSSREKDTRPLHLQHQVQTPNLPEVKETRSGSQVVQKFDTGKFDGAECIIEMSDKLRSLLTEQQNQEDFDSSMSDISEEEEGEEEDATSAIPSPSSSPTTKMEQKSTDITTPKKKSGIPMKMSFKMPSSTPRPSQTKTTSSADTSPLDDARKDHRDPYEESERVQDHLEELDVLKCKYEKGFGINTSDYTEDYEADDRGIIKEDYLPSGTHETSDLVTPEQGFLTADIYSLEKTPENFSFRCSQKDSVGASVGSRSGSSGLSRIPKAGRNPRNEVKTNVNQGSVKVLAFSQTGQVLPVKGLAITGDSLAQVMSTGVREDSLGLSYKIMDAATFPHPVDDSLRSAQGTLDAFDGSTSLIVGSKGQQGQDAGARKHQEKYKSDRITSIREEQHVADQLKESRNMAYDRDDKVKFIVGNKLLCFSRSYSHSSCSSDYTMEQSDSLPRIHDQSPATSDIDKGSDSCGSLANEQIDFDQVPSEQVLLDQCGDSTMPKPRLPVDPDKARRLTRAKFFGQKGGGVNGSRLIKSASVEMTNDYHSGSEIDQESQSSFSQEQSSFENLMTRSCSDTAELVLNLQVPPSSSWQTKCSTWHQHLLRCQLDGNNDNYQINESYVRIITPEETDQLLMENVNLIMSEIQTTKLSGSTVDEDLFIENETISLVSNDYTSDTNSEVSVTYSAVSDKTTDISSATTVSRNQSQPSSSARTGGPRVLKPVISRGLVKKAVVEEEGVKSVRGRRKPLYPGRPSNAAAAARGNLKAVASLGGRGAIVSTNNRRTAQSGILRSESGQAISGLKKTPPRNSAVVQTSPKTAPAQCNNAKNKSPPQRSVSQRSRSAGPATTPRKTGISSSPAVAGAGKVGPQGVAVQQTPAITNRLTTARAVGRIGGAVNKSILQGGTSTPPGNSKIPMGTNMTPSQSRLPNASTCNKSNSNVAANNNNISKTGGNTTRSISSSTLSSASSEKKVGQNVTKAFNSPSAIPAANKRGSESGIPKRKSSGSLSSLSNAESNKTSPAGNMGPGRGSSSVNTEGNKHTPPSNSELNKCNVSSNMESNRPINIDSNKRTSPSNVDLNKNIRYINRNNKISAPNNTDPKGCSSPNSVDPNKNITPVSADISKHILPNKTDSSKGSPAGNANTNRRIALGNTDLGKRTSPGGSDPIKRSLPVSMDPGKPVSPGNTDSNKHISPGNSDPNKRSSPGNTEASKRSPSGTTDPSKCSITGSLDSSRRSPPGKADSNKSNLPGNADVNKNTPTGAAGRRQPASKIATLWKKDRNQDSSPSRGSPRSSTSSCSSKLPVSMTKTPVASKPISGPPAGFKTKAATLPNSSLASSKTRAVGDRISKSSTYEKISSELQGHDTKLISRGVEVIRKTLKSSKDMKQNKVRSDSTESELKRGKIFDRYYSDDDDGDGLNVNRAGAKAQTNSSIDPSDSLENVFEEQKLGCHDIRVTVNSTSDSAGSLDQIGDTGIHIDSSTFRKKKRDPCISDLDLPNADETCRAVNSFNSSVGPPQTNSLNISTYKSSLRIDSIINEMNIISFLHNEVGDSKSDKKNKQTDEKSGGKTKSIVAQGLKRLFAGRQKEKEKELKTKTTDKESGKSKNTKSNSRDRKNGRDKREYDFFRSNIKIEPSTTWTIDDRLVYDLDEDTVSIKSIPLRIETHNSVNVMSSAIVTGQSTASTGQNDHLGGTDDGSSPTPDKHMTKTEMLLARRRKTNLPGGSCEEGCGDDCLVTTV